MFLFFFLTLGTIILQNILPATVGGYLAAIVAGYLIQS